MWMHEGDCLSVCVNDQNYALMIVTEPIKIGISNPFRQEDFFYIYNLTLQNHFCMGLSSFG